MTFDWDKGNISHVALHHVVPQEVEQVLCGVHLERNIETHPFDGERITVIGETARGRILIVAYTWRADFVRPITAWDAPHIAKQEYLQYRIDHYE